MRWLVIAASSLLLTTTLGVGHTVLADAPAAQSVSELPLPAGVVREGDQLIHEGRIIGCVVDEEDSICFFACIEGNPVNVAFLGFGGISGYCSDDANASCTTTSGFCSGASDPYMALFGTGTCSLSPPPPGSIGEGVCISGGLGEPDYIAFETQINRGPTATILLRPTGFAG